MRRVFIGAFVTLIVAQVAVLGTSGVDRVHGSGVLLPQKDGVAPPRGGLFQ